MNYKTIVSKGIIEYSRYDNKDFLKNYFVREYRRAKNEHYFTSKKDIEEWFAGCWSVATDWQLYIAIEVRARKIELDEIITNIKNGVCTLYEDVIVPGDDDNRTALEKLEDERRELEEAATDSDRYNSYFITIEGDEKQCQINFNVATFARKAIEDAKKIVLDELTVKAIDELPQHKWDKILAREGVLIETNDPKLPRQLIPGKNINLCLLFEELIKGGYISLDTDKDSFIWAFGNAQKPDNFKPIKWIKYNSRTKQTNLNKKALLDLLVVIGLSFSQIRNKPLLKDLFSDNKGNPLVYHAANYTGKLESEYHKELIDIANKVQS